MKNNHKIEELKRLVHLRKQYIKRYLVNVRLYGILFTVAICLMAIISLVFRAAYMEYLMGTKQTVAWYVKYVGFIYGALLLILAASIFFLTYIVHKVLRIGYSRYLDIARLLLFFTVLALAINAIIWVSFASLLLKSEFETTKHLIRIIYLLDKFFRVFFFFGVTCLAISFYSLKEALPKGYRSVPYLMILLGFMTIIDAIFFVPIALIFAYKPQLFLIFSYLGIKNSIEN